MIYPKKLNSRKSEKILRLFIMLSILVAVILSIINRLTTPHIHWAALANCGIIYIWITVIYSIKKNTNIAGHVLLQTVVVSLAMLYIDDRIGFRGWSINIAIPIILIVANVTMLILTIVSYKKYIKYAIYQLGIVIISIATLFFGIRKIIGFNVLGNIAIILSVLNLTITLILCYKDIKEVIIRKMHM